VSVSRYGQWEPEKRLAPCGIECGRLLRREAGADTRRSKNFALPTALWYKTCQPKRAETLRQRGRGYAGAKIASRVMRAQTQRIRPWTRFGGDC